LGQEHDNPITEEGATLNENSPAIIPGINTQPKHIESGVIPLTIEEEARRANAEAERQSTKKETS
jgi:hypothetical protein